MASVDVNIDPPAGPFKISVAEPSVPLPKPGPFGKGTRIHVCIHGSCSAMGADALLADLEDLGPLMGIRSSTRGCLGMCGQGPNCMMEAPAAGNKLAPVANVSLVARNAGNRGPSIQQKTLVRNRLADFESVMQLLRTALDGVEPAIPVQVLERSRQRSDALRLTGQSLTRPADQILRSMLKAVELLTAAIETERSLNSGSSPIKSVFAKIRRNPHRLRELLMLRGRACGRCALADPANAVDFADRAIADFTNITVSEPTYAPALAETGRVLTFSGRLQDAMELYNRALDVQATGQMLDAVDAQELRRRARLLEARLAAGCELTVSEDISRWIVKGITGLSWDTCIYHLKTRPMTEPHPFPHDAWHVSAGFDSTFREYTPTSSAEDWQEGRLDLLVKTYVSGTVSRHFGVLQTAKEAQEACQVNFSPMDEQRCWVRVSRPQVTLFLPALSSAPLIPYNAISHLVCIVGGTGVAPALQLLREVALASSGVFSPSCEATMVYCSHSVIDVLMLDELREAVETSKNRIRVWHVLSSMEDDAQAWQNVPNRQHYQGRHNRFATYFDPFRPTRGGIGNAESEPKPLKGPLSKKTLSEILPRSAQGMRIVTCGPPGLMNTVRGFLADLQSESNAIVELQGTSSQIRGQGGNKAARALAVASSTESKTVSSTLTFADRVRAAQPSAKE